MRPMPTSLVVFTLWLSFIVYIIDSPGVIYAFLLAAPTHCNKIKLCLEMIPWSSAAFNIDFVIKSSNCDFNVLIDSELALKMLTSSEFSFNWAATLSQCLMRWSVLFINFPLWIRCVNECMKNLPGKKNVGKNNNIAIRRKWWNRRRSPEHFYLMIIFFYISSVLFFVYYFFTIFLCAYDSLLSCM